MQLTIPKINWGKRKERSQMLEAFTVDGRIVVKEYPAYENYVDDNERAFLLAGGDQYYCEDDRTWHQLVSEIDFVPLAFRDNNTSSDGEKENKDKTNIRNSLFRLTWAKEQAKQFKDAKTNDAWEQLKVIFAIVFTSVTVIVGLIIWQG